MKIPVVVVSAGTPPHAHISRPVTFGVPLPRGAVTAPEHWHLETPDGRSQAVEARVLDSWGDGSARWILVDALVDAALLGARHATLRTGTPSTDPGLTCTTVGEDCTVDTGVARFHFRSGGAFPFDAVDRTGTPLLGVDVAARGLVVTAPDGQAKAAVVTRVSIEHRGLRRASILTTGSVAVGARTLVVETRTDLHAGSAVARVRCTVRNPDRAQHPGNYWDLGDPGSVLFKDVSLVLSLPDADGTTDTAVHYSAEPGVPWTRTGLPFEVYQDSSGGDRWQSTNHINRQRRVPNTFRGYRVRTTASETRGDRATPAVWLESTQAAIGATMALFWQNFPKAIEADHRQLTLRLFPGQYADLHELQGGEQKTHEVALTFQADAGARDVLDSCRQLIRVSASPEWHMASGAIDFLAPLEAGHAALVNQAVDGPSTFDQKREMIDQYGWRHFGEVYGDHEAVGHEGAEPLVSHYNNQYDPILGFGLQYLRTGDARWWSAMDELAGHVIDIDIYHTTRDKAAYNGGLFWHTYHYGDADTATHRTYPKRNTGTIAGGGPSADHNYPSGLVLHYFLTGDEAARSAAVGLAEYVLRLDDGTLSPFRFLSHADTGRAIFTPPDYYGPSRSSGNSLNALVDGHRLTHDSKFLAKADELIRRVVHPNDDQGKQRLDEPEYRWFYAMFLQALGKYLHHKAEVGQVDPAYAHGQASLLAYARWMRDHEYPYLTKPEKLEYPTETWAAQDIRKADIFSFAATHASASERHVFLERASFFHRTSIETLAAMPTRSLARPVIVLMTSGTVLAWLQRHADMAEPPSVHAAAPTTPAVFVPQRKIAERRALLLLALGAVAAATAAVAGLMWWMGYFASPGT